MEKSGVKVNMAKGVHLLLNFLSILGINEGNFFIFCLNIQTITLFPLSSILTGKSYQNPSSSKKLKENETLSISAPDFIFHRLQYLKGK